MCCGNNSMQISAAIIEKLILIHMPLNRHMGHINQKCTIDNFPYLFYYTAYIINMFVI